MYFNPMAQRQNQKVLNDTFTKQLLYITIKTLNQRLVVVLR